MKLAPICTLVAAALLGVLPAVAQPGGDKPPDKILTLGDGPQGGGGDPPRRSGRRH